MRHSHIGRPAGAAGWLLLVCLLGAGRPAHAQSPVEIGGQAFLDYTYQLTAPDAAEEGRHGFTYRRLYLTADAAISDAFSARARLEASEATLGDRGPEVFVKDLYLAWKVGGGHALQVGVTAPPTFGLSETVWGYRSLEKTVTDFHGVLPSRDFGVRADGPLGSDAVRYSLMVGNNSGVFPETDDYKRVYGQLAVFPAEGVTAAVASSWAAYGGPQENQLAVLVLLGYVGDWGRVGAEGFYEVGTFRRLDDAVSFGGSLFGAVWLAEQWGLVGRVDLVERERLVEAAPARIGTARTTLGLVAVVYQPHPQVQLMPNVRLVKDARADRADTQGRLTLAFTF